MDYEMIISKNNITSHDQLRAHLDSIGFDCLWDYPSEEKNYLIENDLFENVEPVIFNGELRYYEIEEL